MKTKLFLTVMAVIILLGCHNANKKSSGYATSADSTHILRSGAESKEKPKETGAKQTVFLKRINHLKESKTDSIRLSDLSKKKLKIIGIKDSEIDDFDQSDDVDLQGFKAIRSRNILKITDNYILISLQDVASKDFTAATFSLNGDPIEGLPLNKSMGNNEFHIYRKPLSKDRYFDYDSGKNEFYFKETRFDTEWINYPIKGKDVLTSTVTYTVGLNAKGEFFVVNRKVKP